MKIAFVYDALFPYVKGGGERRYYEVARRLRDRHDIHFFSWQYWPGPARLARDGVTYHGLGKPPPFYGPVGRRTVLEAALFAANLLPALARERFDIVDCAAVPFLHIFTATLACKLSGSHLVVTWFEFWDDYWPTYLGATGHAARLVERLSTRFGDLHVAISDTTAARLSARRLAAVPLKVNEPGVDIKAIRRVRSVPKSVDLVFAGRLTAQKNIPLLLQALAGAELDGLDLTCTIVSDGPERDRLSRMADRLGLAQSVKFHGRIESDREYFRTLKAGRVFVWPSSAEGFGMAALEAMACGLPVVVASSESSATRALVRDGKTGLVAEANPSSFAAAIRRILADESALTEMSKAATERAARSSWEQGTAALEGIYEDLLTKGTRRCQ